MKTVTKYTLASSLIAILTITLFGFYSLNRYRDYEVRTENLRLETCIRTFWQLLAGKGSDFRIVDGKLLAGTYQVNGNLELPDEVQRIFGGVATIFMGDVRVTTNVLDAEGKRALGTRLVGPAFDSIFKEGKPFRGTAAILGEPYLTAYDPIRDRTGRTIGVLFVGVKESDFLARLHVMKRHLTLTLVGLVTVVTLIMVLLGRALKRVDSAHENQIRFQQTLLNTIPSPVYYKDAQSRYLGCNTAFESYTGFSCEELIGKTPHEIWPTALADSYLQQDLALFENPGMLAYETKVRYADGTLRDVIFNKATFAGHDGEVAGLVGVIMDITERKTAEEKRSLLQAQLQHGRMLESFMVRLSHDLRTPLTPLFALFPLIRGRVADPELRGMLDICQKGVTSMKKLVDRAQMLVRLTATGNKEEFELIPLVSAVEKSLAESSDGIAQKHLECRNEVDPSIVVLASADQLRELFANLVSNAVRFSREHGGIRITADRQGGTVTVAVQDDGIGLAPDHLESIFDEFFKADESRHDLDAPGLGLSICKRIVRNHQGRIWAESPGIGQGTTIRFTMNEGADSPHSAKEPK